MYQVPNPIMVYAPMNGVSVLGGGAFVPELHGTVTFSLNGTQGGTYTWNGANANGQLVEGGVYNVSFVEPSTTGGLPAEYSAGTNVLREQEAGGVKIFNSAGEVARHWAGLVPTCSDPLVLSVRGFVPQPGRVGVKFAWGPDASTDSAGWDGLTDAGVVASAGVYEISVTALVGGKQVTQSAFVEVLNQNPDLFAGTALSSNPLKGGPLTVWMPDLGEADQVHAQVYSLAGALVEEQQTQGSVLTLPMLKEADGIYFLVLTAKSLSGETDRKILKVGVVH